jgi:glutathione S-transferase
MSQLRIFSYLPNPRVWKATIAGRLCGVEVEVRGDAPQELAKWLWDFDARPLSTVDDATRAAAERVGRVGFKGQPLYKTDAFLVANPFGTVPAAFNTDGSIGVFESNSIMRAVARLGAEHHALYGKDPFEASRIDSFLDVSLVFARDAQLYLLARWDGSLDAATHGRATEALHVWLGGMEQALRHKRPTLVGEGISLADICFACELALLHNEGTAPDQGSADLPLLVGVARHAFPGAFAHFDRLVAHPAFAPELGPYLAKRHPAGG